MKKLLSMPTALWILGHIVALASAIILIGPQTIENMFSKDPIKVTFAICGAIVALGATFGAGISDKLVQAFHTSDVKQIEIDISKETPEISTTTNSTIIKT